MTGAGHYAEAERLLSDQPTVRDWRDDAARAEEHWRLTLAEAQVHATLALAAIQAERWIDGDAHPDWPEAIS